MEKDQIAKMKVLSGKANQRNVSVAVRSMFLLESLPPASVLADAVCTVAPYHADDSVMRLSSTIALSCVYLLSFLM